jgi:hypothetical protein
MSPEGVVGTAWRLQSTGIFVRGEDDLDADMEGELCY